MIRFDPTGFWLSEKLDGARCFYDGHGNFISRHGRLFTAPEWFAAGMPPHRLDGELYMGRDSFGSLVSTMQRKGSDWQGVQFHIFDLASPRQPVETRLAVLSGLSLPPQAHLVPHRLCTGIADLDATETSIVANGGEGLCLRAPGSFYRPQNYIKVKRLFPDLDRSVLDR
jgi:DNA ligase-1